MKTNKVNITLPKMSRYKKCPFKVKLSVQKEVRACAHPEAVVPAAVRDLLAGDFPIVVLPIVPVKVVTI